jgi:hypothetical protein
MELQQKLLEQQKLLQEQILRNQAMISQPAPAPAVYVAPSTGSDQKDKKRKQKQENNSNKTSKVAGSTAGYTPYHAGGAPYAAGGFSGYSAMANSSSADEEDDDNDLLFGAVNHVLNAGVQPTTPYKQPEKFYAPVQAVQARPAQAPVDVKAKVQFQAQAQAQDSDSDATNALDTMPEMSSSNPFASSEETMRALQTSGSKHALHGPVRGNIFASPKGTGQAKAPPAGPATLPVPSQTKAPFNPQAVPWAQLPWGQLVAATQAHPKFSACYTFTEDYSWVRSRTFSQRYVYVYVYDI